MKKEPTVLFQGGRKLLLVLVYASILSHQVRTGYSFCRSTAFPLLHRQQQKVASKKWLKQALSATTNPIPTKNSHPMPQRLPPLQNDFFLIRHGQSTANLQGIISSARSLANSTKHGLTSLGWEQGRQSAAQLLDLIQKQGYRGRMIFFYSSPFAR